MCGIMKITRSLISPTHRGKEPAGVEDEGLPLSPYVCTQNVVHVQAMSFNTGCTRFPLRGQPQLQVTSYPRLQ